MSSILGTRHCGEASKFLILVMFTSIHYIELLLVWHTEMDVRDEI